MELEDKVAVVTGGSSGIGKAAARRLAREGAKVAIVARNKDKLRSAINDIEENGGEAIALSADVGDPLDMEAVYDEVNGEWGRLDIVFANAGVNGVWAPIEELNPKEWNRTMQTNLSGTFYTIKYAVPMLKERGGSVVVTSSVNGTRMFTTGGASAYATSKAGQVALTKMLALELAAQKIRVNVICPGAIDTSIQEHTELKDAEKARPDVEFPHGKIPLTGGEPGSSDQVAELVLFLASERSSHITGTPIWIDGAQSLLQG